MYTLAVMQMDEISNPITVYGPVHADVAAHIAREMGTPLFLLSAAGAAAYMGPAWFLALIRQTQERFPEADIQGALDCEAYAGYALAALRQGVKTIIYNGPAFDAIADIASQIDAFVLKARPESLDARVAEASGSLEDAIRQTLSSRGSSEKGKPEK